jgi:hypothetical protein
MKWLFPMCLAGAVLGGFPGGLAAFFFAAGTGGGEVVCFTANLLFGVGGAFVGTLLEKEIRGQSKLRFTEIVLPVFLGVVCGIAGYLWLDWAVSHADPPL